MSREFGTPEHFQSDLVTGIKRVRRRGVAERKDLSPTVLDCGTVEFRLARHFGFCFGVENAIEIAYRALAERGNRRVFLLSEMIHSPVVNEDLIRRGAQFLLTTSGTTLIPFSELSADDVVILPAFGISLEILRELEARGVDTQEYDTTCPFVERVWKKAKSLAADGFSLVVHGKHYHEETRATFSRSAILAPTIVVRDTREAEVLGECIRGRLDPVKILESFSGRYSEGYNPADHLRRIGVVNQTTMLAEDTLEVTAVLRDALVDRFGLDNIGQHFADTRDTLCYATSENQASAKALVASGGHVAVVVGGFKSSNTAHLAALCRSFVPTFHIESASDIFSPVEIRCLEPGEKRPQVVSGWLPALPVPATEGSAIDRSAVPGKLVILVTAGASTPDSAIESVIRRLVGVTGAIKEPSLADFREAFGAL